VKVRLELGWPPPECSPNVRGHWRVLHRARHRYSGQCYMRCYEQLTQAERDELATRKRILVRWVFHPPRRRRRDADNCVAMMKQGQDGVAGAIGVDDSCFLLDGARISDCAPDGLVVMELE